MNSGLTVVSLLCQHEFGECKWCALASNLYHSVNPAAVLRLDSPNITFPKYIVPHVVKASHPS